MSDVYIVIYDFESDQLRGHCAKACLDAGLQRIQLSVFCGRLPGVRHKRLLTRFTQLVEKSKAKVGCISVLPLPSNAAETLFCIHNPSKRRKVCHPVDALREKTVRDFVI